MTERTYEMLWDCHYCGTKRLLGLTHRHCPECGAAQDPTWRYFPADEDKVAVQDHVHHGADLICPACRAPAGTAARCCGNCGSPLEGGGRVRQRVDQVAAEGSAPARQPAWPEVRLRQAGPPAETLGNEREGGRSETYTVWFLDTEQRQHGCELSQAEWNAIPAGSTWNRQVGRLTGSLDCATLKPHGAR